MYKVVIFGGGGFIDSSVADQMLRSGHTVRIFERAGVHAYRNESVILTMSPNTCTFI